MNRYTVQWETKIGPGSTYYQGKETVYAEDEDNASAIVQHNVWRRAFQDCSKGHIVIVKVEPVKQ